MDNVKIGKVIYSLRKEKGLTQLQLARKMNISDKTVSKWERGIGCPDISLLAALADIFNVDLSELISGQLTENNTFGGNMKRMIFYVCPKCGNIITSLTDTGISCCGKRLMPCEPKKADDHDRLNVERIENDYCISSDHEMTKEHYISFVALISSDSIMIRKQYPQWDLITRIPIFAHGRLVWYCTKHGLFYMDI